MKTRLIYPLMIAMLILIHGSTPATSSPFFAANSTTYLPLVYGQPSITVWTADPANKIQPTTAIGAGRDISLEGARSSYEAWQIIVTAKSALAGVNMTASALSDGAGHSIPASNITFFRETFIDFTGVQVSEHGNLEVPANSPTKDARLPDALIPFTDPYTTPARALGAPFNVAAGLNQPVWMDVFIPKTATAGTYNGTITVTASGMAPTTIRLTLTVWNFVLPDMNEITTYFQLSLNELIDYHSGIADCSSSSCWLDWNARARTIVKRYEELAHKHRVSSEPAFIPDPSNGCSPPTDWSAYDSALQPYMNGTYWSDGVPSSWISTPFAPGVTWGLESDCTQAQYTTLAAAWATHLKAKGWFSKAIAFAYDEPEDDVLPDIAKHAQWMQNGDRDWKAHILVTTPPRPSIVSTLNPAVGIYTVCPRCYDRWDGDEQDVPYGRNEWPGLFAQNIKLWFYESNAQGDPYPTFATNTLLGNEPRMMMWGSWFERASGFLLWDMAAWDAANPWGPNVRWAKTGDGVLIYPGNHNGLKASQPAPANGSPADVAIDGPIPSYRLKIVRAGLQDWALFKLAQQRGLESYARQQVAQAYGQFGGCEWSGCPAPINGFFWKAEGPLMQQIRHNIGQAIHSAP